MSERSTVLAKLLLSRLRGQPDSRCVVGGDSTVSTEEQKAEAGGKVKMVVSGAIVGSKGAFPALMRLVEAGLCASDLAPLGIEEKCGDWRGVFDEAVRRYHDGYKRTQPRPILVDVAHDGKWQSDGAVCDVTHVYPGVYAVTFVEPIDASGLEVVFTGFDEGVRFVGEVVSASIHCPDDRHHEVRIRRDGTLDNHSFSLRRKEPPGAEQARQPGADAAHHAHCAEMEHLLTEKVLGLQNEIAVLKAKRRPPTIACSHGYVPFQRPGGCSRCEYDALYDGRQINDEHRTDSDRSAPAARILRGEDGTERSLANRIVTALTVLDGRRGSATGEMAPEITYRDLGTEVAREALPTTPKPSVLPAQTTEASIELHPTEDGEWEFWVLPWPKDLSFGFADPPIDVRNEEGHLVGADIELRQHTDVVSGEIVGRGVQGLVVIEDLTPTRKRVRTYAPNMEPLALPFKMTVVRGKP